MTGVRPMPPPTSTVKPTSPRVVLDICRPMSCQAMAARSSFGAADGDLELARQEGELGVQRAPLAQDLGIGARVDDLVGRRCRPGSSLVMLRMQLPLVWMPCMSTSASRSITSAALGSGIQLNWQFWRVVKWA